MKKTVYCLTIIFASAAFIFTGCIKTSDGSGDTAVIQTGEKDNKTPEKENTDDDDINVNNDIPPDEINSSEANENNNEEHSTEGNNTVPAPDNNNPGKQPDTPKNETTSKDNPASSVDPELQPYWNSINEIASAAQQYYSENFNKVRLISKNGKLYNSTVNMDITASYLASNGYLASKYSSYDCDIMLVKTEDMGKLGNVSVSGDDNGLAVFVVTKNPKDSTYLVTSARSTGGIISNGEYIDILNRYDQNHGAIGRLMSGTDEYNRILNFISMYEGKFGDYYVRSITKDNKYAVVVLSGRNDVNDLKQYVLKKENNVWEVVMDKLENEPRVNVAVNKKLPDFNPSLLPKYTIYDYKNLLISDYTGILHFLMKDGFIDNISDVKYMAGADKYCYVTLNNEIKYICFYANNNWTINQVSDYNEAYSFMIKKSVLAPTFIIWDR